MSIKENILYPLKLEGMGRNTINAKYKAILEKLHLEDDPKKTSKNISGGEKQKIALARATRCCSPPDKYVPSVPIIVSMPCGSLSRMSSHWAADKALLTSSLVASGLAALTFSKILALNR